jgi:hypothetical protein
MRLDSVVSAVVEGAPVLSKRGAVSFMCGWCMVTPSGGKHAVRFRK